MIATSKTSRFLNLCFRRLTRPDGFRTNRTDTHAELLKLVADEPKADAQLRADATVGLPQQWRCTI
ncbi:hypothetical protein NG796_24715 [Laspinema sp. A4]|nr:hypothetical protein [Laspinema sp. D2d]